MLISCDGHLFFDPGYHLFFGGKKGGAILIWIMLFVGANLHYLSRMHKTLLYALSAPGKTF